MLPKKIFIVPIFILAAILCFSSRGISQDVAAVNPQFTKVLADTLGVRMIKNTLAPGDMLAMHTHPVQIIYVLEGGQITVNFKDGKKQVMDLKTGQTIQLPPDPPHTTTNTGKNTLVFVNVEISQKHK
jgi:quercetin dioxygenase-like cupin family protein